MGLGETQVFQDEKSRLANTTVARIVAAKGSLNDPETKKECCRKLQKLNATLKDHVAAVDAAMARDAMKGGVTGLGCDNRKLIAVLCTRTKASLERTKAQYRAKFDADLAKDVREKTGSDYGRMMAYALAAPDAYRRRRRRRRSSPRRPRRRTGRRPFPICRRAGRKNKDPTAAPTTRTTMKEERPGRNRLRRRPSRRSQPRRLPRRRSR